MNIKHPNVHLITFNALSEWVSVHVHVHACMCEGKTDSWFWGSQKHQPNGLKKSNCNFITERVIHLHFHISLTFLYGKNTYMPENRVCEGVCLWPWECIIMFIHWLQQCNSNLVRWWSFILSLSLFVCFSLVKHVSVIKLQVCWLCNEQFFKGPSFYGISETNIHMNIFRLLFSNA